MMTSACRVSYSGLGDLRLRLKPGQHARPVEAGGSGRCGRGRALSRRDLALSLRRAARKAPCSGSRCGDAGARQKIAAADTCNTLCHVSILSLEYNAALQYRAA